MGSCVDVMCSVMLKTFQCEIHEEIMKILRLPKEHCVVNLSIKDTAHLTSL